ncbi:p21-activated protein kinase-interacting protein 1 [Microtus ochrogaster]|uniref:p21-activated protein kinase-interacting protein 1 n=1 Tax=Microtus ochrogaster TaxID=79684 RepID=A0A8J6KY91_MICOH|nr:p21-activated protein kinase-interacting protein 1 [Microtus ochrogaster]
MELVAGSYEQVLFGFRVHREPATSGDRETWTPVADFTHHAHTASLSAVAANNRFVVTGSKDETIHIYDLKKKIEHGALLHHSGTVTCLKFYGTRHLISGAEDGLICVWDAKKWECLKSIKAHKGHVTFLSIHPSGKLALSVDAHIVEWSPSGEKYIVVVLNKVDVYQLDTASVSGTITNGKRISSVTFLSDSVLAVAGDEEVVRFFDCDSLECLCEFKAHENRLRPSSQAPPFPPGRSARRDVCRPDSGPASLAVRSHVRPSAQASRLRFRVPLHYLGFGYAALVATGGIIGYAKAATSGTLAGIMGMRFYNSGKFMPAGLIAGASCDAFVGLVSQPFLHVTVMLRVEEGTTWACGQQVLASIFMSKALGQIGILTAIDSVWVGGGHAVSGLVGNFILLLRDSVNQLPNVSQGYVSRRANEGTVFSRKLYLLEYGSLR